MSSTGSSNQTRKLSKANLANLEAYIQTSSRIQTSSLKKTEGPLRRRPSKAKEEAIHSYAPSRLSAGLAHHAIVDQWQLGPFSDDNRVEESDDSDDADTWELDSESNSTIPTPRDEQPPGSDFYYGRYAERAEIPRQKERPHRRHDSRIEQTPESELHDRTSTQEVQRPWQDEGLLEQHDSKSTVTTTYNVETGDPKGVSDVSNMDKARLVELVDSLHVQLRLQQSQLDRLNNMPHHEQIPEETREHPFASRTKSERELINYTRTLRAKISVWAGRYFEYESNILKIEERLAKLEHVVAEPASHLGDDVLGIRLIQARLWDLLHYHIFDNDKNGRRKYHGHIWIGGRAHQKNRVKKTVTRMLTEANERVDRNMRPLDDVLRPDPAADSLSWKAYLEWRSATYNLLVPPGRRMLIEEDERRKQIKIVAGRIWKSLKGFTNPDMAHSAIGDLKRIVSRSMWLDLDFRQQMAQYEVRRPWKISENGTFQYFGIPFNPNIMVDRGDEARVGHSLVNITTAPGLFRSHDWSVAGGREAEVCLLKAKVSCSTTTHD